VSLSPSAYESLEFQDKWIQQAETFVWLKVAWQEKAVFDFKTDLRGHACELCFPLMKNISMEEVRTS
jgi:hypothetical protein